MYPTDGFHHPAARCEVERLFLEGRVRDADHAKAHAFNFPPIKREVKTIASTRTRLEFLCVHTIGDYNHTNSRRTVREIRSILARHGDLHGAPSAPAHF
jgi:hypothetical protein